MQAPGALRFFQKTFPVFKSFSKVYYARIVKSPLISALLGCDLRTAPARGVLYVRNGPASFTPQFTRNLRVHLFIKPAHTQAERLNKALVATQFNSSTSTAHKPTPRVHTLLATACN